MQLIHQSLASAEHPAWGVDAGAACAQRSPWHSALVTILRIPVSVAVTSRLVPLSPSLVHTIQRVLFVFAILDLLVYGLCSCYRPPGGLS